MSIAKGPEGDFQKDADHNKPQHSFEKPVGAFCLFISRAGDGGTGHDTILLEIVVS
jgi:hypothetical protein